MRYKYREEYIRCVIKEIVNLPSWESIKTSCSLNSDDAVSLANCVLDGIPIGCMVAIEKKDGKYTRVLNGFKCLNILSQLYVNRITTDDWSDVVKYNLSKNKFEISNLLISLKPNVLSNTFEVVKEIQRLNELIDVNPVASDRYNKMIENLRFANRDVLNATIMVCECVPGENEDIDFISTLFNKSL